MVVPLFPILLLLLFVTLPHNKLASEPGSEPGVDYWLEIMGDGDDKKKKDGSSSSGSSRARPSIGSAKFEVEKFDGTNNFGMWQYEMMDLLGQQELDIALEDKPDDMGDAEWKQINKWACGSIRMCLAKDQKFFIMKETSAKELWKKLEDQYMVKSAENRFHLKRRLFRFDYRQGISMSEHISDFNKIIADLVNLDVQIDDEDKALCLLNSLSDDYEHLITTLLHGKNEVKFDDVCNSLINNECRKKEKQLQSRVSGEALVVRGRSDDRKSGGNRGKSRSKSRSKFPAKDECAFCRLKGHWKKDCPKLKNRDKKGSEVNVAKIEDDDDFDFALSADYFEDIEIDFALASLLALDYSDRWIMDSGCTHHMCPNREWFSTLRELDGGLVLMGNDSPCRTKGLGTVRLKMHDGSVRELTNVRYVPNLKKNLISLGTLESKGHKIILDNGVAKVVSGSLVIMKGTRERNLYFLQGGAVTSETAVSETTDDADTTRLWHMRLGHAGEKAMQGLVKQGLLKGAKTCKLEFCEHCVLGKQTRVKFGTAIHQTKGVLDYVHTDVWGPTKTTSLGGKRYYVTFVDDFSRRVWVYTMKHRDEVLDIFVKWKKMIETQTGRKIKRLRSDNGGEYKSDPFLKLCQDEGIVRHFTVRGTPQQNGVAERMNRTLLEKVRCMLSNAGLDKKFWAEAVTYAGHLINRLPTVANDGKTPMEVWSGKPATDYHYLHIFGCPAYYHVRESKLDPRAKKAIFMGFSDGVKGFRLWCPDTRKTIVSRDVTFDESVMLNQSEQNISQKQKVVVESLEQVEPKEKDDQAPDESTNEDSSIEVEAQAQESPQKDEPIAVRKGKRNAPKPAWLNDMVTYALPMTEEEVPTTYEEAVIHSDQVEWEKAMGEEMKSLYKNKTWELVQLPHGKRAIGCKWVFAKKEGSRYKARLVAKGYAQKEGVDYNEVFSPVVKHSSIRILLALVAQFDLELAQLDVKTAFLHGELKEEIYMTQPNGFKVAGKEKLVCKLHKSLYGLKQSPRQWYKRFDKFMSGQKYTRSLYDPCVYFRKLQDGTFIYLLLYVDDMLIASKSKVEIDKLKSQLSCEFEMKDLGEAKKILGMEIERDRSKGKVCLSQKQYMKKVLQRFGIDNKTKPVSTPLASHFKLKSTMSPSTDDERKYMAKVPYASAVGSLMYCMVCTRPDISQALSVVCRYMHNPGKGHWQAVKWILRYILGTVDVGLVFEQDKMNHCAVGYVDSDYAGDLDKCRSTTAYVFTLASGAVSWKSNLQHTIALSTTEAEYMAVTEGAKEALWLRGLLEDLGVIQDYVDVYCDSQSAIHLAENQVTHNRTKHIHVRFHKIRQLVEDGDIQLLKVGTEDNPADMLTKSVPLSKFKHCLDLIGVGRI